MKTIQETLNLEPIVNERVTCLGGVFSSDQARQEQFSNDLRESGVLEQSVAPGYPVGNESAILRLSDPPYFTLCPNPFLKGFLNQVNKSTTESGPPRQPYVGDLRPTGQHPVHAFHPYHTKVPPEIIKTLIEHYTSEGELVLDGFAGSGMTGVAAAETGRNAILCDLSPVACFIAGVNCTKHDAVKAVEYLREAIAGSRTKWGRLYQTVDGAQRTEVHYFVWSDVFRCPTCKFEFAFFDHGVVHHGNKVETLSSFPCPSCKAELTIRRIDRVMTPSGKKKRLVWVNAGSGKARANRAASEYDVELAAEVESIPLPTWIPNDPIDPTGYSAKLAQLGDKGIATALSFLSRRNLLVFADLWQRLVSIPDSSIRVLCVSTLTSIYTVVSERQGYFGGGGGMSGNLYMPVIRMEKNVYDVLERKIGRLEDAEAAKTRYRGSVVTTCQSSTDLYQLPDECADYIYIDPPFGANIIYSEMNLLLESWLEVRTNSDVEVVIDPAREKDITQYTELLRSCLAEFYRVLKPGRWITVEFHNTNPAVWNAIQSTLGECGFVVAQTNILDKGSTTILGDIRPGSAKHDLLISAYKPSARVATAFRLIDQSMESVWTFLEDHLRHLPLPTSGNRRDALAIQRQKHVLFDRMVAFHVQRGLHVPLSTTAFYEALRRRFVERDGLYLLPDQAKVYQRVSRVSETPQFTWAPTEVVDEITAITWLETRLARSPGRYDELTSEFDRVRAGWKPGEQRIPLEQLLKDNFQPDGPGAKDSFDEGGLLWRLPNEDERERLRSERDRRLLDEFERIRELPVSRRPASLRTEALRRGFAQEYDSENYKTILDIASWLPPELLQEDEVLLMYYDAASRKQQL